MKLCSLKEGNKVNIDRIMELKNGTLGGDSNRVRKILEGCVKKEEVREIMKNRDFGNEKMRCIPACMMKKFGVLHEGNELDVDKIIEKLGDKLPESPEVARAALEECAEKAREQEDECEFAQSVVHCIHQKKRRG